MYSKLQHKRRKLVLPLDVKLKLIKRINRGEKMVNLAIEYGIGRSTIHDIYKNRAKIQEFAEAQVYRITKRPQVRRGKYPQVEEALYEWYLQEKKTGMPISGMVLTARAKEIYKEIFNTEDGFPKGNGWIGGFKRRYKVKFTRNDDDLTLEHYNDNGLLTLDEFKNKFYKKIIDLQLCPSQVYIATENELCWRLLRADFASSIKDKISFLSCANASGLHKLKLMVTGKSQKSRAFKNVNLPIHYFVQKITPITEESFKMWFENCFLPESRKWLTEHNLPPKALLLVDQSLHNTDDYTTLDDNVAVIFYPSECKDFMPLNYNVMKLAKQSYKRHLLLTASSKDFPIDKLRQYNMRDMVFDLSESWQSLAASTIAMSWKEIWESMVLDMDNITDDKIDEESDISLLTIVANDIKFPIDTLKKWFFYDDWAHYSKEISRKDDDCAHYSKEISPKDDDCAHYSKEISQADEEGNDEIINVSTREALCSFDKCIHWAEQNGSTSEEIALLRKLRDKALFINSYPVIEFVGENPL